MTTEERLEVFATLHERLELALVITGPLVIVAGLFYGVFSR